MVYPGGVTTRDGAGTPLPDDPSLGRQDVRIAKLAALVADRKANGPLSAAKTEKLSYLVAKYLLADASDDSAT